MLSPWFIVSIGINLLGLLAAGALAWKVRRVIHARLMERRPLEVAFIGDSIIYEGQIWDVHLGRYGFRTQNYGACGSGVASIAAATRWVLRERKPQTIVLMAGGNDAPDGDIERTWTEYLRLLDHLRANGTRVFILSTLPRSDAKPGFVGELNHRLMNYTIRHGKGPITFVDLRQELAPEGRLGEEYTLDGIHLSKRGYEILGRRLGLLLDSPATSRA